MASLELHFLGATGTVTGSRFLVQHGTQRVLIDCGLYQGLKDLRLRNWDAFPVPPASVQTLLLTHAHLDHSGYLPRFAREGFSGPIITTSASRDLADILLRDSATIMEEEAEHAGRGGWSKHKKPLPLYTVEDVEALARRFKTAKWHETMHLNASARAVFYRAGHILGAASIRLEMGGTSILFSGDLGRKNDPLLPDPESPPDADYIVMESTYGNRLHDEHDPLDELATWLDKAYRRGGSILIPAFAVGRVQTLMHQLWKLRSSGRLPPFEIWVDSPMASRVTGLYRNHCDEHRFSDEQCRELFEIAQFTETRDESIALQSSTRQRLVISASGMATGGRVLFHLANMLGDERNLVLFAGYQAAGTRGADLVAGKPQIKIHGRFIDVKAEVVGLKGQSAHADAAELTDWVSRMNKPPKRIYLVHGEPDAAKDLQKRMHDKLGVDVVVPDYLDMAQLT